MTTKPALDPETCRQLAAECRKHADSALWAPLAEIACFNVGPATHGAVVWLSSPRGLRRVVAQLEAAAGLAEQLASVEDHRDKLEAMARLAADQRDVARAQLAEEVSRSISMSAELSDLHCVLATSPTEPAMEAARRVIAERDAALSEVKQLRAARDEYAVMLDNANRRETAARSGYLKVADALLPESSGPQGLADEAYRLRERVPELESEVEQLRTLVQVLQFHTDENAQLRARVAELERRSLTTDEVRLVVEQIATEELGVLVTRVDWEKPPSTAAQSIATRVADQLTGSVPQ